MSLSAEQRSCDWEWLAVALLILLIMLALLAMLLMLIIMLIMPIMVLFELEKWSRFQSTQRKPGAHHTCGN
jgi:hypothetical protein